MTAGEYGTRERWISSRDRVQGATLRLFCLPHAGAGASAYQTWKREMPPSVELCPVRLPGREMRLRESPYSNSRLLVQEMSEMLLADCDIPYAIFGHSMGAVLAYELAQALRERGAPEPVGLFLSGRVAPHLELSAKPLHGLAHDRFLAALEARYGGLPREVLEDQEMLDFYLPILRADLRLIETYRYDSKPALNCPVLVTAGTGDTSVWMDGLEAWKEHTSGPFELKTYPGGHFYLSGEARKPLLSMLHDRLTTLDRMTHM